MGAGLDWTELGPRGNHRTITLAPATDYTVAPTDMFYAHLALLECAAYHNGVRGRLLSRLGGRLVGTHGAVFDEEFNRLPVKPLQPV